MLGARANLSLSCGSTLTSASAVFCGLLAQEHDMHMFLHNVAIPSDLMVAVLVPLLAGAILTQVRGGGTGRGQAGSTARAR